MKTSTAATRGGGSSDQDLGKSCPLSVALISWGLIAQGVGLLVVLVMLVICACEDFNEIADEFSGLVTLLLLTAALLSFMGYKLRQGSAWTRVVLLWIFPVPVLNGFIEGTYAPLLLALLAAQYVIYLYVLTKPEVRPCFRTLR